MNRETRALSAINQNNNGLDSGARKSSKSAVVMIQANALRNFKELVTILGGDAQALLQKSRIEPRVLEKANGVLPYRLAVHLLERASAELASPDFGMRLAAMQVAQGIRKILDPLDPAMRNAPTLGAALRYCADHIQVYSTATRIEFEGAPEDRRIFMSFDALLGRLPCQRQAVEQALAITQYTIKAISGNQVRAREIWFTHEQLAPKAVYDASFGAPIRFGQRRNGVFLDALDFNRPIPNADSQRFELATRYIDHRFPAGATALSTRVRTIIASLLAEGDCTPEGVASTLGLHLRTLQRRLREEGESLEAIKDSVRRDVALRYLRQPNVSLGKVTEILGYSEASVLSRSCHRWFAASPRQLRNEFKSLAGH